VWHSLSANTCLQQEQKQWDQGELWFQLEQAYHVSCIARMQAAECQTYQSSRRTRSCDAKLRLQGRKLEVPH
jgi:hypothetical protein